MKRRNFLKTSAFLPLAAGLASSEQTAALAVPSQSVLPFLAEKSHLKISQVRMVRTRPKQPVPSYSPAPGSWSVIEAEVANPMSIYPKYKPKRSLFMANDLGPEAVEITTDKGLTGIGFGGPGAGFVIENIFPNFYWKKTPSTSNNFGTLFGGRLFIMDARG